MKSDDGQTSEGLNFGFNITLYFTNEQSAMD